MSAYFLVYQNVTDSERYEQYLNAVIPVIERRGGRFIAQGAPEAVEGMMLWQRVVLLEWSSGKDFLNFWHSDEYTEIKKLRQGAAEWQAALVEGIQPISRLARPTTYHTIEVDGLNIFYRQAGAKERPTLLLLHGLPTSSHMYQDLINRLSDQFHLVALDYPGFGNSDTPPLSQFDYSFERLADLVEHFLQKLGLDQFSLYVQDYGAPIGFRIAARHPEWIQALIIQNGNAYEEGLTSAWQPLRNFWQDRTEATEASVRNFLSRDATIFFYTAGVRDRQNINPDHWNIDQYFLDRPENIAAQIELLYSYQTNLECYPQWQQYFRQHQPPTLIVWGKNDPFFSVEGAKAFTRDLQTTELHFLDTGHFALDEEGQAIAKHISNFIATHVD